MSTEILSKWAVVQTGAYTADGVVVPFVAPDGQRMPSILFTDPDHGKCVRKKKRLLLLAGRYRQLGQGSNSDMILGTPVLGVVPITIEQPKKQPRVIPIAAAEPPKNLADDMVATSDAEVKPESKRGRKRHEAAVA